MEGEGRRRLQVWVVVDRDLMGMVDSGWWMDMVVSGWWMDMVSGWWMDMDRGWWMSKSHPLPQPPRTE